MENHKDFYYEVIPKDMLHYGMFLILQLKKSNKFKIRMHQNVSIYIYFLQYSLFIFLEHRHEFGMVDLFLNIKKLFTKMFVYLKAINPTVCTSLSDAWSLMKPSPAGILDQLNVEGETSIKLTASIYLPQQSRLVVGREDGSIIIVPATQTVMLQLLHLNRLNIAGNYDHSYL